MHYPRTPEHLPLEVGAAAGPAPVPESARPLRSGDFRRIAENGFGDGSNSYAYSATWYDDHLYIGSNRHIVPMLMLRSPFSFSFSVPPVPLPEDYTGLDLRGQIWRYSVASGEWTRVYHAPLIPGYQGMLIPQAFGFRGMVAFKGTSDSRPAIYTVPAVGRNVLECVTLRSADGVTFETLPAPRAKGSSQPAGSFRAMMPFKGRLFVAPSAAKPPPEPARIEGGREVFITLANTSLESAVMVSADPASGEWELSSPPLFGDATNASIIDMAVCGDYLYVGTLNIRYGFQLWRTTGEGPPPHHWELVLDRGADRGALNQAVLSMAEFHGDLYVGTCIQNGGMDKVHHIGPAAGEVLRVRPDGSWDLVVGDPRITRQGLKVPVSGMRSGFNNPLCSYIWRMCAHDGALYVGTCDNSSFVQFTRRETWPEHVQRVFVDDSMEKYLERLGGCELWRTTDGDNWVPVTRNGFGNRFNHGIRAIISTPSGLFVGTANPFGPQVAVREGTGWKYQDNPRGGLEVWHGSLEHRSEPDPAPPTQLVDAIPPIARRKGQALTKEERRAAEQEHANLCSSYALLEQTITETSITQSPFLRLATEPADLAGLSESHLEDISAYFSTELRNVGYWRKRSFTPAEACTALVHELALLLPVWNSPDERRSILVLGAGGAELSAALEERFDGCQVDVVAPDAWPPSDEGSYDAAVCIEVSDWLDRGVFLERLAWVLKPGATAAASECLVASPASELTPAESFISAAAAAGLALAEEHNVTGKTWVPFCDNSRSYFLLKLLLQQIDTEKHAEILSALPGGNSGVHAYSFFRLKKPEVARTHG